MRPDTPVIPRGLNPIFKRGEYFKDNSDVPAHLNANVPEFAPGSRSAGRVFEKFHPLPILIPLISKSKSRYDVTDETADMKRPRLDQSSREFLAKHHLQL